MQAGTKVGKHVIINANTTIDHDVVIEDFVSVYPNTYIGGGANITKNKIIEPNQVIARNTFLILNKDVYNKKASL